MNSTRRFRLSAGMMMLIGAAVGCGGSPMPAAYSPAGEPVGSTAEAPASPDVAISQPYQQPGANPGSPPPPAAMPTTGADSSSPAPEMAARKSDSATRPQTAPEPVDRPGLGTQWGETRVSRISTVPFVRASATQPMAVTSLFYNDEEGARAMANLAGFRRMSAQAYTLAGGAVAIGLRSETGSFLSGFVAGDKTYVIGEAGRRYTIVLRNLTSNRLECVVSVDGLDVLDGQAASFNKRGYLVDPNGELEIDGFRQSTDTVAAFRFGSVRGSYANQKHGDTRNVGVIGVALFHERGTNPWSPNELNRRQQANPFPGQFATPPGQ